MEPWSHMWIGPLPADLSTDGVTLRCSVPAERWPFGPPSYHETCCNLHPRAGRPGGLYCDCKASAEDDAEFGGAP